MAHFPGPLVVVPGTAYVINDRAALCVHYSDAPPDARRRSSASGANQSEIVTAPQQSKEDCQRWIFKPVGSETHSIGPNARDAKDHKVLTGLKTTIGNFTNTVFQYAMDPFINGHFQRLSWRPFSLFDVIRYVSLLT
jgi:hypothetical protein